MTSNAKPTPLYRAVIAIAFVTIGVPSLIAYCLFYPPSVGFGVFDAVLLIGSFFFLFLLLGVLLFRTRRINVVQSAIFLAFSISSLATCLLAFAFVYRKVGILDPDGKRTFDPLIALYFSAITWTTVGYGDFTPSSEARLYAASEALLAYVFMAVLIAGFLHLLARFRSKRKSPAPTKVPE